MKDFAGMWQSLLPCDVLNINASGCLDWFLFHDPWMQMLPLGSLGAHIAPPWNIDESLPVSQLMQQLLWCMLNRLTPLYLKCASVSTWCSLESCFFSWQRCHMLSGGEIKASAEEKSVSKESLSTCSALWETSELLAAKLKLRYSLRLASISQDDCITLNKWGLPPPHQCTAS